MFALYCVLFGTAEKKKKAFCEAVVQKEKEDIFCDVFWELSNRRQKTIIIIRESSHAYARDETVKTVSSSFLRLQSTTISRTTLLLLLLLLLRGGRRL